MDQITKPSTNGTRFAVSRVYQPARIERELLAQIFDLVERGVRQDFEPGGATQEPVVIATRVRLSVPARKWVSIPESCERLRNVAIPVDEHVRRRQMADRPQRRGGFLRHTPMSNGCIRAGPGLK